MNWDECFSWRLASESLATLIRESAADVHPPLYYILLKAWAAVAGDSEIALRALSVVFWMAAIIGTFLAARAWASKRNGFPLAGAIAAVLVAFNGLQFQIATTVRMYSLGCALAALSLWTLAEALRFDRWRWRWWVGFAVASIHLMYTHNFGLFTVAGEMAVAASFILFRRDRAERRAGLREFAVVVASIGFAYLPWLFVVVRQSRDVAVNYWIDAPDYYDLVREITLWATGAENLVSGERIAWGAIALVLFASVLLQCGLGGWVARRFWRSVPLPNVPRKAEGVPDSNALTANGALACLLIALAPWFGCLAAQFILGRPLYQLRYLSFAQIPFLVFLGLATASLPTRIMRIVVAATLVLTAATGLYERVQRLPRGAPGIAQAMGFLQSEIRPGEAIIVDTPAECAGRCTMLGTPESRTPFTGQRLIFRKCGATSRIWRRLIPRIFSTSRQCRESRERAIGLEVRASTLGARCCRVRAGRRLFDGSATTRASAACTNFGAMSRRSDSGGRRELDSPPISGERINWRLRISAITPLGSLECR